MNIIRYQQPSLFSSPIAASDLHEEFARLFDVAFPKFSQFQRGSQDLPLDLYHDKDNYYARLEIPGFQKEELNVEVANGVVTVSAQQNTTNGETKKLDRRISRSFSLPSHADPEKIQARYETGILTLTFPKKEEAKPRQIAVKVN